MGHFQVNRIILYKGKMNGLVSKWWCLNIETLPPDSKVHGTNMGPIWGRQDPGGPHVGPMNFAIWVVLCDEIFRRKRPVKWNLGGDEFYSFLLSIAPANYFSYKDNVKYFKKQNEKPPWSQPVIPNSITVLYRTGLPYFMNLINSCDSLIVILATYVISWWTNKEK